jgi:hypothetical protein
MPEKKKIGLDAWADLDFFYAGRTLPTSRAGLFSTQ